MTSKRTLILATEYGAGMGPYVASMVNTFEPDDDVRFILVENASHCLSLNIRPELKPLCTFIEAKPQSAPKRLANLLFGWGYNFTPEIKKAIGNQCFDCIHVISSFDDVELAQWLRGHGRLILTVHDLEPHLTKKAFYKVWRQNEVYKRYFLCLEIADALFTNSHEQFDKMQSRFPGKNYFYAPFPTLVTPTVAEGGMTPPELPDDSRYVLFFGRIEAYKGIENLVKAFEASDLPKDVKLVIAGRGVINTPIDNDRIIVINRFIDDREIASLYQKASCVVYPYISATQSGVLSLALYFNTPILASSLPYFHEILGADGSYFFQPSDMDSLSEKLTDFFNGKVVQSTDESCRMYKSIYAPEALRESLLLMLDGHMVDN